MQPHEAAQQARSKILEAVTLLETAGLQRELTVAVRALRDLQNLREPMGGEANEPQVADAAGDRRSD